jgi:hypothetical protein
MTSGTIPRRFYVRSVFGTCRISAGLPVGSLAGFGSATARGGSAATAISRGALYSTEDTQQAHVHRTQKAGQPLSGSESFVPIAQISGSSSALRPLASATSSATMAMRSARRISVNGISARDRRLG